MDHRDVFGTQREREPPLDRQARAGDPRAVRGGEHALLAVGACARFVHAREHVAQLRGERAVHAGREQRLGRGRVAAVLPFAHVFGHVARPVLVGEVVAQQLARGAHLTGLHMGQVRAEHAAQQRVLFGAVEQFGQRQARTRTRLRDEAERERVERGGRARLRAHPSLVRPGPRGRPRPRTAERTVRRPVWRVPVRARRRSIRRAPPVEPPQKLCCASSPVYPFRSNQCRPPSIPWRARACQRRLHRRVERAV